MLDLIRKIQEGKLTEEQLVVLQRRLAEDDDVLDTKTADEEGAVDGLEENEVSEDRLLAGVIATSLADLVVEREQVVALRDLARKFYEQGGESKFDKLREVLTESLFAGEKFLIFTEHRDTLNFLVQRLSGMGYTGQIAQIHGGMYYTERQVGQGRQPARRVLDVRGLRLRDALVAFSSRPRPLRQPAGTRQGEYVD